MNRTSMMSRRTMLAAIACAVSGCAAPAPVRPEQVPAVECEPIPPSGDALLDELRRLAVNAPIEVLLAKRLDFVSLLQETYPDDQMAWLGVGRLADAVLSPLPIPDRRLFGRWLAQTIQAANPDVTRRFVDRVATLRDVR